MVLEGPVDGALEPDTVIQEVSATQGLPPSVSKHNSTVPEACPDKPAVGNRTVRAEFGQKKSHNEELAVTSCGVVIGRKTFLGSEGPENILVCYNYLVDN
jgi:hypothetical protein